MINFSKKIYKKTYPPATPECSDGGRGNLRPNLGFTIIEMLVVVGIIGVVTGIIMSSISGAKAKGRDAKRIADISIIQLALERYYDINRNYPTSLSSLVSIDSSMTITYISGNSYSYSGNSYLYKTLNGNNTSTCSSDCQSYHLGATLELYNGILADDVDLPLVSGDFNGADNTTSLFVYDVVPKF